MSDNNGNVSTKKRQIWADVMRIVAAWMVIAIHLSYPYSEAEPKEVSDSCWLVTNFLDNYFRSAVPLFVMLSGFLLMNKKRLLDKTFPWRLLKLLIPLIAWSAIYLLMQWISSGTNRDGVPITLSYGIKCILTGNAALHLWFLYMMFSLYLVAPILHAFVNSAKPLMIKYFLMLWFIAQFAWPILSKIACSAFDIDQIAPELTFYLVHNFVGFFIAGYYFSSMNIRFRSFFLLLIGTIIVSLGIAYMGFKGYYDRIALLGYLRVPFFVSLFLVLKYIGERRFFEHGHIAWFLARISSLTFGIYLVHYLVLRVLQDNALGFSLGIKSIFPLFSIPVVTSVVFIISAAITWLIIKIPIVRWIIP
ncbi:MAG: acyltransferase family protein [Planctomycetaceae bacterium]|nr:acyltransferase family protein [Planctomycetaceae bacterium]